jgi:hypothetical protein
MLAIQYYFEFAIFDVDLSLDQLIKQYEVGGKFWNREHLAEGLFFLQ